MRVRLGGFCDATTGVAEHLRLVNDRVASDTHNTNGHADNAFVEQVGVSLKREPRRSRRPAPCVFPGSGRSGRSSTSRRLTPSAPDAQGAETVPHRDDACPQFRRELSSATSYATSTNTELTSRCDNRETPAFMLGLRCLQVDCRGAVCRCCDGNEPADCAATGGVFASARGMFDAGQAPPPTRTSAETRRARRRVAPTNQFPTGLRHNHSAPFSLGVRFDFDFSKISKNKTI